MNVAQRQAIERRIAQRVVKDFIDAGYKFQLTNGGDGFELKNWTRSEGEILRAMFQTDEETLHVRKDLNNDQIEGWVLFVYGNDGFDVIADNTINIGAVLAPVEKWVEGGMK